MGVGIVEILFAYLLFVIPIFAVVLRAAVATANRFLPTKPVEPSQAELLVADVQLHDNVAPREPSGLQDSGNPFQAPVAMGAAGDPGYEQAIPTPRFGRAYMIALSEFMAMFVFGGLLGGLIGAVAPQVTRYIMGMTVRISVIGMCLPIFAAVLTGMLPTTYLRGLFVALLQLLIGFLLLFIVGFVIGIFMFAFGG